MKLKGKALNIKITQRGLEVAVKNKEHLELIKKAIQKNQNQKYDAETKYLKKKNKPRFILYNLNKDTTHEVLPEALPKQNNIEEGTIKVFFKMMRPKAIQWVLETEPVTYDKLKHKQQIYIGGQKVNSKDFIFVLQCNKYW